MSDLTLIQQIAIWALPVLLAITVHEVSHGYVARLLGDDTAARAGRLTFNPLAHVDLVGTLIVPALLLLVGGFLFGWAKPVPVDFRKLGNPRRDMALVAAAGPGVNAFMAFGWALLLKISLESGADQGIWLGLRYMALAGIAINLTLMVLNLIPIPPLDGGRVAVGLLPLPAARLLARLESFGLILLVLLLATGLLSKLMFWPLMAGEGFLFNLLGINSVSLF